MLLLSALVAAFCLTAPGPKLTAIAAQAEAQVQAKTLSLGDAMPVDPQITIGRFPNGLRYYIRHD